MPAGLPGSTAAENAANPSAGAFVIFDALSGPKGSPFDRATSIHASTGALSTGIGFGTKPVIEVEASDPVGTTVAQAIRRAGFNDDQGPDTGANSTRTYIGGGRSVITNGLSVPSPYTAGFQICGAGEGGSRDGGAGPAFTGFPTKMVTAVGSVANGAAIEAGFTNRSGLTITVGQSVHGSGTTQNAAPV